MKLLSSILIGIYVLLYSSLYFAHHITNRSGPRFAKAAFWAITESALAAVVVTLALFVTSSAMIMKMVSRDDER